MCPASAEDKYYAIRLIKYSFKKRKKIKNTGWVHIFFFIKVCTFLHTISTVCSCKTDYIILTIQCVYFYIRLHTIYSCKTCRTNRM